MNNQDVRPLPDKRLCDYPPVAELREKGYEPIASAYEEDEKGMFHNAVESLGDKHFMIATDRFNRRVIMRLKSELKSE